MPRFLAVTLALVLMSPIAARAQAGSAAKSVEPFKVGTFRIGGMSTVFTAVWSFLSSAAYFREERFVSSRGWRMD